MLPIGRYDERFIGHAPHCAAIMFAHVCTQQQVDAQWEVLERWAAATAPLGDWRDWQQVYLLWSMKLAERALGLDLELPSPAV
jgi:hypothetical protein